MTKGEPLREIAVGIAGASGAAYARGLLAALANRDCLVHLAVSAAGRRILLEEEGIAFNPSQRATYGNLWPGDPGRLRVHSESNVGAGPASGSSSVDSVVIVPCSAGTLGRIACGTSENLIGRMADVALKERRRLILVLRETPLSLVHLRNMVAVAEAGAVVLPASPGFYRGPQSVSDLVEFIVDRILRQLGMRGMLGAYEERT